jgi:methylmalonyl-CoA mutase
MQKRLLSEFPEVTYESWRKQVDKDLKGADFEKRLLTRTLEGIVVQPLYTARDVIGEPDAAGFAGLSPYRRGAHAIGQHAARWDMRAEQRAPNLSDAKAALREDLASGASSLWLRFDARTRHGASLTESATFDGLPCANRAELSELLSDVDLSKVAVALDAGGNASALAAAYLSAAAQRGIPVRALHGNLGADPLGALARDGALPYSLEHALELSAELAVYLSQLASPLRAAQVSTVPYHDAGASLTQELAYALATGLAYLRANLGAGLDVAAASMQIGFRVCVASDLFLEIAKLRALRLCWAKIIAAHGGDEAAQNTHVHVLTSYRTKTARDPFVNMLRTTTETFSAMLGGADALTTRGFDELLGPSDSFARRIARNTQTILNEESHVTHVADAAGGSYYVENMTDALARAGWQLFQQIEERGGMATALVSGSIADEIAKCAELRAQSIAKRSMALTGINEFANLGEEPVLRPAQDVAALRSARLQCEQALTANQAESELAQLTAAKPDARIASALRAAEAGASIARLTQALAGAEPAAGMTALPVRRHAEAFERLRARCERYARATGQAPSAFLCNLGSIPEHKARASFASGFLQAGGVRAIDNEGFGTPEQALAAFVASAAQTTVLCGSDQQYTEWVPKLAPLLRERGAKQIILAGKPAEHAADYTQAGVSLFIYLGVDVAATLAQLLDSMGVAS